VAFRTPHSCEEVEEENVPKAHGMSSRTESEDCSSATSFMTPPSEPNATDLADVPALVNTF